MKTKVHCKKVLCCGINRSQETGSVAYTYVTLTAEYHSAESLGLLWLAWKG